MSGHDWRPRDWAGLVVLSVVIVALMFGTAFLADRFVSRPHVRELMQECRERGGTPWTNMRGSYVVVCDEPAERVP